MAASGVAIGAGALIEATGATPLVTLVPAVRRRVDRVLADRLCREE